MKDVRENPELAAALSEVHRTFQALQKARAKFNRCTREDSRESARVVTVEAEREYRVAADKRDKLVELDRARRMQTGDPLAAAHNTSKDGPAIDVKQNVARAGTVTTYDFGRDLNKTGDPRGPLARADAPAKTAALRNALAHLRAAGRVHTHGPETSIAFEVADQHLQEAAIRFVAALAYADPSVRLGDVRKLKPINAPPVREFQGPGTSGHPTTCGCAACRNFDD